MDKISVIVPVYNAEKYLKRCLDSIINQTYKNLEIILINDGSNDSSLEICKEYEKKDKRIFVYNQKNKGISYTRNRGIELSSGKYISFVDSDDVISLRMYEILHNLIIKENVKIAECKYINFNKKCEFKENNNYNVYFDLDILKENLKENISNFLWNKLILKELFVGVKFKENIIFEDQDVIYKLLEKTNKVIISDSVLYGYFQRDDSYIHTYSYKKLINYINVYSEKHNYLLQKYPSLKKALNECYIYNIFILYRNIVLAQNKKWLKDKNVILERKKLKKFLKETKINFSFIKNILIKILNFNDYLFYIISSFLYKIKGEIK